mgnify:CR=1 FL=1
MTLLYTIWEICQVFYPICSRIFDSDNRYRIAAAPPTITHFHCSRTLIRVYISSSVTPDRSSWSLRKSIRASWLSLARSLCSWSFSLILWWSSSSDFSDALASAPISSAVPSILLWCTARICEMPLDASAILSIASSTLPRRPWILDTSFFKISSFILIYC